jgi:diaminopimelate decarboxylase
MADLTIRQEPVGEPFDYRDGVLYAEDVPVADIAAQVGTPFYCYSTATLSRHYRVFAAPSPISIRWSAMP